MGAGLRKNEEFRVSAHEHPLRQLLLSPTGHFRSECQPTSHNSLAYFDIVLFDLQSIHEHICSLDRIYL